MYHRTDDFEITGRAMSDFFIGQLLVFAALLPVLLRPFLKPLRELTGIPLLALLAAAVCAGTAASGARFLFFPLFAFTLIVLFSQMPRLVSMARGLPSDWFGTGTKIFNAFALALLAALAVFSALFMPESSYVPEKEISAATERMPLSAGFRYRFHVFTAEEADAQADNAADILPDNLPGNTQAVILYFPSFPAGKSGRDTLLAMAAERGFTALAAHWSGKNLYSDSLMNPEGLRDFRQIIYSIGQSFKIGGAEALYAARFEQAQEGVMQTVILDTARFAAGHSLQENPGGSVRLFAIAEGYACASLAAVASANPGLFAGAVYLLPEEKLNDFNEPETSCFYQHGLGQAIPNAAAEFPQIAITDSGEGAFGFGEMTAEDPALAALLGLERDRGRRLAQLAGERVLSWIEMRNARMDSSSGESARIAEEEMHLPAEPEGDAI